MYVASALGGKAVIGSTRVRLASLALALMLAATTLLLVQQRAEAVSSAPVAASIAGGDAYTAQISFTAIVCPILLAVRDSFSDSPFFGFVAAILDQFLVLFGCSPSG